MLQISNQLKETVIQTLIDKAEEAKQLGRSNAKFATSLGINKEIFSRLKNGEREKIISDGKIIELASRWNINETGYQWKIVKTDVFKQIESDILHCKEYAKSRPCADDTGIGKTVTARYLSQTLPNCFYVNCKSARRSSLLVKAIAKAIGIEVTGTLDQIKKRVSGVLRMAVKPIVILDDVGYVSHDTVLTILELMDETENSCGWYSIGDDTLERKFQRGIDNQKVGYRAWISRNGKRYTKMTPVDNAGKIAFLSKLIKDVAIGNAPAGANIDALVKQCLKSDINGLYGDLRRLETLIIKLPKTA